MNYEICSIKKSNLSEVNKKYLTKFLDVTKSQLFFSNGVIFVEGISEALLISKFSKLIGKNEEYNIEKKGIEIVIVNGVAFEHFAKLFNAEEESKRLNIRSVIITDDDRSSQTGEVPSRAQNALNLKGGLLNVEIANITFEYELFLAGESNRQVLIDIFRSMHPVAAKRIDQGNSIEEYAENFLNKVISNKAKSELSYQLALKLDDDLELCRTFKVPTYIEQAIKWVVKGE